jgi:hypothetical protein
MTLSIRHVVFLIVVVIVLFGSARTSGQTNTNQTNQNSTAQTSAVTPWIAPSAVSAVVALISLIYAMSKDRKAEREKKAANIERDKAVAKADALQTRLFYKARSVSWQIEVLDLEGRLKTLCTFEDIHALPKGATLTTIPGALGFAPPNSQITQYPTLRHYSFVPTQTNREVRLTVGEPLKPNSCEYLLSVIGSLPYGHSLSYQYELAASNGIFMSKEEVEQNTVGSFRKEFWAHYVTTPVDLVEITISFPADYSINRFFVGVCIGKVPSENLMYGEEIQRIEELKWFQSSPNRAQLRVENPFVGFTYLVYWIPPAKRIVDTLKQSA